MGIENVGVVGCGLMGSGIAEACARAGLDVRVVDLDQATLERGRERVAASIARARSGGKLSEAEADMLTLVIVGNSRTRVLGGSVGGVSAAASPRLYTPRGYFERGAK